MCVAFPAGYQRAPFIIWLARRCLELNGLAQTIVQVPLGSGSVLRLAWSWEGTRLAAACANATLHTADLVGHSRRCKRVLVTLTQPQELSIYDAAGALTE